MDYSLPSFTIDKADFLKGNNSYENLADGGEVTSSFASNPFSKPGLLTIAPDLGNSVTASLPSEGVLTFGFAKGSLGQDVMAVATNSSRDGYFYLVSDVGAMTAVGSADTTNEYTVGKTDTVFYQGSWYTTTEDDIVKNSVDLATRDVSFWVTTKGKSAMNTSAPHPLVVFGDIMYVASANAIHQLDGSTATESVFVLGTDWVITAMTVYDNLIYIVAEQYYNYSGVYHGISKMYTWDGYSGSWLSEWDLNYRFGALYVFENIMYMWTKDFMGYWDGARFRALRPMTAQTYKHQITEADQCLFFVDGVYVVRYGSPSPNGTKKFFNYFKTNENAFTGIAAWTEKKIVITKNGATNMSNFYVANVNAAPAGTGVSQAPTFNPRYFKRPVYIRHVVVETEALASSQSVIPAYLDDAGSIVSAGTFAYATTEMQGKTIWTFDVFKRPTMSVKPRAYITADTHVRRITYYYDPATQATNA